MALSPIDRTGLELCRRGDALEVLRRQGLGTGLGRLGEKWALASSALDQPLPQDCVVFGEISLSGDIRTVGRTDSRLKEAAKLGFSRALAPGASVSGPVTVAGATRLADAVRRIGDGDWR